MTTYTDMTRNADPTAAPLLAAALLKIYEADRTQNCGVVNGEAVLCQSFRAAARWALLEAGVTLPEVGA